MPATVIKLASARRKVAMAEPGFTAAEKFQLIHQANTCPNLPNLARRLAICLVDFLYGHRTCWPGQATLSEKLGCSADSIRVASKALVKAGLWEITPGSGRSPTYYRPVSSPNVEQAAEALESAHYSAGAPSIVRGLPPEPSGGNPETDASGKEKAASDGESTRLHAAEELRMAETALRYHWEDVRRLFDLESSWEPFISANPKRLREALQADGLHLLCMAIDEARCAPWVGVGGCSVSFGLILNAATRGRLLTEANAREEQFADQYRELVFDWLSTGTWNSGPRPGERGCFLPLDIMRSLRVTPWEDKL